LPTDERNLVIRAALALREHVRRPTLAATIELEKRIPSGGGLGGGSSDAATTLLALNELWSLKLDRSELCRVADRVGSDVPFFLFPPSADCRGRGEVVTPLPPPKPRAAVLILPGTSMPTPAVYRRFDELSPTPPPLDSTFRFDDWAHLDTSTLLPRLVNDLEPPAFSIDPKLGRLRDDAERLLGRAVRMSGSGSTLFTLFDTIDEAEQAAELLTVRLSILSRVVQIATLPIGGR
jgi:4-diphosphocytidyl-2-C-methyl-D-erythritol kinase